MAGNLDELVARVVIPLDRALGAIARFTSAALEPLGYGLGRAMEPVDALLTRGGELLGTLFSVVASTVGRVFALLPVPGWLRSWFSSAVPSGRDEPTLQARIRGRYGSMVWLGVIASTAIHGAVFTLSPTMRADDVSFAAEELTAVEIPPDVEIPPPPARLERPATPVIAAGVIDEDITIATTTFEDNPVEDLPPPPEVVASTDSQAQPTFTPYTVAPRLLNRDEVIRILSEEYPSTLRNAGVGGVAVVWIHVDDTGVVTDTRLFESSGFRDLDEAALRVAERMEFSAALNRDRPAAVWIQLPLEFQVR